jgi:transposase-like protein
MTANALRKGHGEKRSRKQEMAILYLMTEKTVGDAAKRAGITERTLWRWMQDDNFQKAYSKAKSDVVGHATARLRQSMTIAVDTLAELCRNKHTPAIARANAARAILEFAFKAHQDEDLQARIERLEDVMGDE